MLIINQRTLGIHIRDVRKVKSMTQKQLAERAGLTQQTISAFENGAGVSSIDTLYKILAALELRLSLEPRSNYIPDKDCEW